MNGPSEELKQRVRGNQNKLKQLKSAEEVDNRSLLEREHPDFPINRKELKQNKHTTITGGLSPDTGPRH